MTNELSATSVTHAHIKRIQHPTLGVEVDGRSCVRTLRFRRRVRLDHLELRRPAAGRSVPPVPAHPAHLLISVLDGANWRVVQEVNFPRDPRITGDGIPPETPAEVMDPRFWAVSADQSARHPSPRRRRRRGPPPRRAASARRASAPPPPHGS